MICGTLESVTYILKECRDIEQNYILSNAPFFDLGGQVHLEIVSDLQVVSCYRFPLQLEER